MQISIAGSWINFQIKFIMLRESKGYTLIELILVIILIGLMLTISIPRFRDTVLTDNLKSSTRRIVGMIKTLREDAMREQKAYTLQFDLDGNSYWIDSPSMTEEELEKAKNKATTLPSGISILDIQFKEEGKKMVGNTGIRFNKKGYIQPSAIHLGSEDGREFTLVLSPFLGRVEIINNHVDF
ncbi:MAG: prepilin-type N-terminal cleavage/methylation domain-containing protein [Deltaproteobacteria bacterium]|nr:prepilin-type N-terminal cleavage/methylation domain-containing protein [Deltaproteobacteria bacterium]